MFSPRELTDRAEAALLAWSALNIWPLVKRSIASARSMLSPRERECLELAFQGKTARETAQAPAVHRAHGQLPPGQCHEQAEGGQQDGGHPAGLLARRDLELRARRRVYIAPMRDHSDDDDRTPP